MIKNIFLFSFLLFILYSFFVISKPRISVSQHQFQDNIIKAQKFIYNDSVQYDNIIVGSSLSCRLIMDSLPNSYNLSFGGQSLFDGLDILSNINKLPKNVFIEMNVVLRGENEKFVASILSPISFYSKKFIPSLREDKQPLGIIGIGICNKLIVPFLKYFKYGLIRHFDLNSPKNIIKNGESDFFTKSLRMQEQDYSITPNNVSIDYNFKRLNLFVTKLKVKGVNIVFFELPVNSHLIYLTKANIIRNSFFKYFLKNEYRYIPIPNNINFITTDGLHLGIDEAMIYTSYFKSKMKAQ